MKLKYNGCQIIKPLKEDAQYHKVFKIGAVKTESYDWRIWRPSFEKQGNTFDCTVFTRCNCGEYVARKSGACDEEGKELNFSDLHLAVLSGTTLQGNNLNSPSEAFRKQGIVIEKYCAYDSDMLSNPADTWEKRQMKVNEIPANARRYKGGNHSWVQTKKAIMMDALDWSPLQIAVGVDARWEQEGIIPRCDDPLGLHSATLEKIRKDGIYRVFDSVNKEEKLLASDYKIIQAKSFRDLPEEWKLTQQEKEKSILSILGEILKKLAQVLGLMQEEIKILPIPDAPQAPAFTPSPEWGKYPEELKLSLVEQIRGVCGDVGLTQALTIDLIRTCWAESGLNPFAQNEKTQDFGLCQLNIKWYLTPNKMTPEEAINNPLKCVRIMAIAFKAGRQNDWIAHRNFNYKKCPAKYYE